MLQWNFFWISHFNQGNRFSQGSRKFPRTSPQLWESHLFSWINLFRYKGFVRPRSSLRMFWGADPFHFNTLHAPLPIPGGCCLEEINFSSNLQKMKNDVARLSWLFSVVQKRWDISKCEEIWRILSWSFVNCLQFTTTSFVNGCIIFYMTVNLL